MSYVIKVYSANLFSQLIFTLSFTRRSMNNLWIQCVIKALSYVGVFYDIITFPVYFLIQRPWVRRNRSQRIKVSVDVVDILWTQVILCDASGFVSSIESKFI